MPLAPSAATLAPQVTLLPMLPPRPFKELSLALSVQANRFKSLLMAV
jgi:hypothetical protein